MAPQRTIEQRLEAFRGQLAGLSPGTDEQLDADELSQHVAGDLFELLLDPSCCAVAVSKRLVFRVLVAAIEALQDVETVQQLPLPSGPARLIIVGDTHGQLQDVLTILKAHGLPSVSNRYLFNGDIADRGPYAVEIFMLVLLFQLTVPGAVCVTRGNHEARDINERPASTGGGFADEVRTKYDDETFELFQLYFWHLPLAAVVGPQILVLHGGLSREPDVDLDTLRGLDRKCDIPRIPSGREECILFDTLWSDPQEVDGISSGGRGDETVKWGPDVTRDFLARSGVELLVRSHQVPASMRGYAMSHNATVLTVFSASNYGGVCQNSGAVLIIPASGKLAAKEHMAVSLDELRANHTHRTTAQGKKLPGIVTMSSDARATDASTYGSFSRRSLSRKSLSRKSLSASRKSLSRKSLFGGGGGSNGGDVDGAAAARLSRAAAKMALAWEKRVLANMELDADARHESQTRLVQQLLGSIKSRICEHKLRLRGALKSRHEQLVAAGLAATGGGLLPLSEWREAMAEVLGMQEAWGALPDQVQNGLAPAIPSADALDNAAPSASAAAASPTASPSPGPAAAAAASPAVSGAPPPRLDASLFPAVHYESFLERFQVELAGGEESASVAALRGKDRRSKAAHRWLLSVCYAQSAPLRRALTLAAQRHGAAGDENVSTATADAAPEAVPRNVFVAGVRALIDAVVQTGLSGTDNKPSAPPPLMDGDWDSLVSAAPTNVQGHILFAKFLDALTVVDTSTRPPPSSSASNAASSPVTRPTSHGDRDFMEYSPVNAISPAPAPLPPYYAPPAAPPAERDNLDAMQGLAAFAGFFSNRDSKVG